MCFGTISQIPMAAYSMAWIYISFVWIYVLPVIIHAIIVHNNVLYIYVPFHSTDSMVQNQTVQFCKWRLDDNNIAVFRSTSPESGGSAWTRSLCWCSSAGTTTTGRAGSCSGGLTRPATSASPRRRTPASRGNSPSGRRRSSRSRRRRKRWRTGRRTRAWRTNFTQVGVTTNFPLICWMSVLTQNFRA